MSDCGCHYWLEAASCSHEKQQGEENAGALGNNHDILRGLSKVVETIYKRLLIFSFEFGNYDNVGYLPTVGDLHFGDLHFGDLPSVGYLPFGDLPSGLNIRSIYEIY
jgi:hypothetical protein